MNFVREDRVVRAFRSVSFFHSKCVRPSGVQNSECETRLCTQMFSSDTVTTTQLQPVTLTITHEHTHTHFHTHVHSVHVNTQWFFVVNSSSCFSKPFTR